MKFATVITNFTEILLTIFIKSFLLLANSAVSSRLIFFFNICSEPVLQVIHFARWLWKAQSKSSSRVKSTTCVCTKASADLYYSTPSYWIVTLFQLLSEEHLSRWLCFVSRWPERSLLVTLMLMSQFYCEKVCMLNFMGIWQNLQKWYVCLFIYCCCM